MREARVETRRGGQRVRAPLFMGGLSLLRANARARAPINVFNVIYKRLGPLSSTRTNRASIHRAHARAPLSRHTRARALAHHAREFFTLFLYSRLSSSRLESTLLLSCRLAFSLVSSLAFCLSHLISLISIAISPLVFRLRRSSLTLPCLPLLSSPTPQSAHLLAASPSLVSLSLAINDGACVLA